MKYVLVTSYQAQIREFSSPAGTIFGHAAAASAVAVGAVPFYSPSTIEPYSSLGDVTIFFDKQGTRLGTPVVRQKPDIAAPDDVNTTFFGSDSSHDADTQPNFAGTSAAAPHAAAVAALIWDVNPHLTRDELVDVLRTTAVDLGAAGRDNVFGVGRIDAEAARIKALTIADATPPAVALASPAANAGWSVTRARLQFSEPLLATSAATASNYTLLGAGPDGTFGNGDDVSYTISPAYDANSAIVDLTWSAPTTQLGPGKYRLTLESNSGIKDEAGNELNSSVDPVFNFTVSTTSDIVSVGRGDDYVGLSDAALNSAGQLFVVSAANPTTDAVRSQLLISRADNQSVLLGPDWIVPTDIANSLSVENASIWMTAAGGLAVYDEFKKDNTTTPDNYEIAYNKLD
ncbi:MAG TPA: S8 family serine peptidase, partial [Pirellulaceae bacterium]|nr:S8 family serine peptidase [Pirellulaceae bacterium]